jgi:hypothetical protein
MARRAHLDTKIFAQCGASRELVAATTGDLDVGVVGMNLGLHFLMSLNGDGSKRARSISGSGSGRKPGCRYLGGRRIYPQKLWIRLWKEIESRG